MARFACTVFKWHGFPALTLNDTQSSAEVIIALRGATALNFTIPESGKPFDLFDGFASAEELKAQGGARFCIMAPFANRIPDGIYTFQNKTYTLKPSNPLYPKVRHGLAKDLDFHLLKVKESDEEIEIILQNQQIRPGKFEGYPFAVDLQVTYRFDGHSLVVTVTGINQGNKSLPFFSGWHPYFKTSDNGIDHCQLEIPAQNLILTDSQGIPLPDKEAYSPLDNHSEIDFRPQQNKIIGSQKLDYCYTNLQTKSDDLIHCRLIDPQKKMVISVFQESGVVYAFSGDTVKYRPRHSLAIEPVQSMTNSFNRPEMEKSITIKPGASSSYRFGVRYDIMS